jgi:hypothetical protein
MNGDELKCDSNVIPIHSTTTSNLTVATPTFFNIISRIIFNQKNKYPSEAICPYIFSNSKLTILAIFFQIKTILISNLWSFNNSESSNESTINSNITELDLKGYGYSLDASVLHPLVFELLQWIEIYRSLESIQTGLFNNVNQLQSLHFNLDSLKNFFHKISIEWTLSLPLANQPWIIFTNFNETTDNWVNGAVYTYPDSDFCLFAQYPQQPNITYIINTANLTKCTITMLWLLSNYFNQNNSLVFKTFPILEVYLFNLLEFIEPNIKPRQIGFEMQFNS